MRSDNYTVLSRTQWSNYNGKADKCSKLKKINSLHLLFHFSESQNNFRYIKLVFDVFRCYKIKLILSLKYIDCN